MTTSNKSTKPRQSGDLVVKELGLKDHMSYGLWTEFIHDEVSGLYG